MREPGKSDIDPAELGKFEAQGDVWWSRRGGMRALREITPARAGYVASRVALKEQRVVDVGCGGGILAEALACRGARVTGIDPGAKAIRAAQRHSLESGLSINYEQTSAEPFAAGYRGCFDVAVCMELLEHVPDPSGIVRACALLVRPGGDVFFATLNRTFLSRLLAVILAEYCLGIVTRGTHDFRKFVKPAELAAWAGETGLEVLDVSGLLYVPWVRFSRIVPLTAVNYLMHCRRSETEGRGHRA
ncbi:MAG: bifunctional 2-polyprenyl-6-hydroxyphenol methylase/3-demethylubiquinol 3-O-methyltransferase UbiG [Desulfohalobiaceae bacterium]|nr:bifunctional 2-polyprenyl-6-hydroxyphenol methylase/3-demethylubiquinol 3-O-methyltransferase UbiG [Desulfohalobiaceae bacterium]